MRPCGSQLGPIDEFDDPLEPSLTRLRREIARAHHRVGRPPKLADREVGVFAFFFRGAVESAPPGRDG